MSAETETKKGPNPTFDHKTFISWKIVALGR